MINYMICGMTYSLDSRTVMALSKYEQLLTNVREFFGRSKAYRFRNYLEATGAWSVSVVTV